MRTVDGGLTPLRCDHCGAPVPAVDADEATCPHCERATKVPEAHRRAAKLVAAQRDAIAAAEASWARFDRETVRYGNVVALSAVPTVLLVAGLVVVSLAALHVLALPVSPRAAFGLFAMLPLAPSVGAVVVAYWLAGKTEHAALLRVSLAAHGKHKAPTCRLCGAALHVPRHALVIRCAYCAADNLVTVDAMHARELAKSVEAAKASLEDALASVTARRRRALWAGRWMVVIWLGLIALPALWAFVPWLDAVFLLVLIDFFLLAILTQGVTVGMVLEAAERTHRGPAWLSGVLTLLLLATTIAATGALWWLGQSAAR